MKRAPKYILQKEMIKVRVTFIDCRTDENKQFLSYEETNFNWS